MDYLNDDRLRAEFFGTLCLVLIGCASMVLTGFSIQVPMGFLGIALSFGLTYGVLIYVIGPVSGCHLNPAVTAAHWSAGRIELADAIAYAVAQFIGALVGAFILFLIIINRATGWDAATQGLGQTIWLQYGIAAAAIAEFVGTLLLAIVFLAVTGPKAKTVLAGLIVGLTLVVVHLAFIAVSGASFNPARSLAPALFARGTAIAEVLMYLIVPTLGGLCAGWLVKSKTLDV